MLGVFGVLLFVSSNGLSQMIRQCVHSDQVSFVFVIVRLCVYLFCLFVCLSVRVLAVWFVWVLFSWLLDRLFVCLFACLLVSCLCFVCR